MTQAEVSLTNTSPTCPTCHEPIAGPIKLTSAWIMVLSFTGMEFLRHLRHFLSGLTYSMAASPAALHSSVVTCKTCGHLPMSEWCTPCKPRLHARGGLKSLGCNKARWILDGDDTEFTARLAAMKAKEDALEGTVAAVGVVGAVGAIVGQRTLRTRRSPRPSLTTRSRRAGEERRLDTAATGLQVQGQEAGVARAHVRRAQLHSGPGADKGADCRHKADRRAERATGAREPAGRA